MRRNKLTTNRALGVKVLDMWNNGYTHRQMLAELPDGITQSTFQTMKKSLGIFVQTNCIDYE